MRRDLLSFLLLASLLAAGAPDADAGGASGRTICRMQSARCHGRSGRGTKKHPEPPVGERSPAQLAAFVARAMPEDAKAVAAYIYDAFNSPGAAARLDPPRVTLSHLTVPQCRNTVADLVAGFGPAAKADAGRGLRGEYSAGRNFRDDSTVCLRRGASFSDGERRVQEG